jgi:hypothetical protein
VVLGVGPCIQRLAQFAAQPVRGTHALHERPTSGPSTTHAQPGVCAHGTHLATSASHCCRSDRNDSSCVHLAVSAADAASSSAACCWAAVSRSSASLRSASRRLPSDCWWASLSCRRHGRHGRHGNSGSPSTATTRHNTTTTTAVRYRKRMTHAGAYRNGTEQQNNRTAQQQLKPR